MKVEELRIGDWVLHQGVESQIYTIDNDGFIRVKRKGETRCRYAEIKGLKSFWLTPYTLKQLGFKPDNYNTFFIEIKNKTYSVGLRDKECCLWVWTDDEMVLLTEIDSLHHLQNVIYDLTGFILAS